MFPGFCGRMEFIVLYCLVICIWVLGALVALVVCVG